MREREKEQTKERNIFFKLFCNGLPNAFKRPSK
jgi:hypothetical protein